jgi:REP element-mobilizing transposase RayT
MARLPRNALPEYGVFHVTARGVDRCVIYRDEEDYALFENLLRIARRREKIHIEAYCLMPNHYHAVVEAAIDRLSRAMHWLNGLYAQAFNQRHERVGHLFQSRFHSRPIGDDEHLANACEYVWNNPVRAGLCAAADNWPWSGRMLGPRVDRR